MEDAVVCIHRDAIDIADGLGFPGGEDEESAVPAGSETRCFGFPVTADRFLLDMDQGIAALYAAVLDDPLSPGYAWSDYYGGSLHYLRLPQAALLPEGFRLLIRDGGDIIRREGYIGIAVLMSLVISEHGIACLPMTEHLHPPCPAKEEEIAEGGIVAPVDDYMQAPAHKGGIKPDDDGTAGVIIHIMDHRGEVPLGRSCRQDW